MVSFFLVLSSFAIGDPAVSVAAKPAPVSLFTVNRAPEKFEGKLVVFDELQMFGGYVRRGDQYELQVFNAKGAKADELTFVISRSLANDIMEEGYTENKNYTVRLTCRIEKVGTCWQARVLELDMYREVKVLKVCKTLKDE